MNAKMVGNSGKHQKAQALLDGIEHLAGVQYPALIPNGVPKILMALYQIDVLIELHSKAWDTHVSKKYVDKDTSLILRRAMANRKSGEEGRECTPAEVYKKAQEFGIEKKHKIVQVLAPAPFSKYAPTGIGKYGAVIAPNRC